MSANRPVTEALVVVDDGGAVPEWAAAVRALPLREGALEREDGGRLQSAACVFVAASPVFARLARRLHELAPAVQVIQVAPKESIREVRRSLLYTPGLGEVWIASPAEVTTALVERAAGVTRQRRRFERTQRRLDRERVTASPQRNERALLSDAYLAGLLEALPDAVFSVDAAGRILSTNAAAVRMFGGANTALTGERLDAVLRLEPGTSQLPFLDGAAGSAHVELRYRSADGEPRVGELRATAMRALNGTSAWAVVLRDVTEERGTLEHLRRTAAALRTSESSFRALADAIPTLAWTAKSDGYIDWYNQRWYEYTGTTPEQMEGWGWRSVHHPDVLTAVLERWTASIESGAPFEMTFPLRSARGEFRSFLTRVVPVRDGAGRIHRWFGTNTDVEAEHASRLRVERLQSWTEELAATRTIDDVSAVVLSKAATDAGAQTGTLVVRSAEDGSPVILRQTGMPDRVAIGTAPADLDSLGPPAESMRTGQPIFLETRDDVVARFPDQSGLWELLGTRAIVSVPLIAAGQTVGAMAFTFATDRAFSPDDRNYFLAIGRQCAQAVERARLFHAEREARKRADEANRAKSAFLANMSHELRTPLNAIGGFVELIAMGLQGAITAEQRESLHRIGRAKDHLQRLIEDVLNFAKIESGRIEYHLGVVDLGTLVSDTVTLMAPQFAARRIALETRLDAAHPQALQVCADPDKVKQIVLNLLSNAWKFTEPGGRVDVSVEPGAGDVVEVHVADTGCGIPANRLETVFEPFIQIRPQYGSSHQGTGLGLSISRDLARAMHGDLRVESRAGEGSTFTLRLPRPAR
jgi:PAS domain S-box-containing protein